MFLCMSLCHTGYTVEDYLSAESLIMASNKEEEALLKACHQFGMTIKKRNQSDTISFKYLDIKESYRILKTFPFSSERKMMSVIVQRQSDN